MMLYAGKHRDEIVPSADGATVRGCPVSGGTVKRFRRLLEIDRECRGLDNPRSRDAVGAEMGSSYFYYYFFGLQAPQ